MPKKIKCDEDEVAEVTCVKKSKPRKRSPKKRRYKTKSAGKKKGSKSPKRTKSRGKRKSRGKGRRKKTNTSQMDGLSKVVGNMGGLSKVVANSFVENQDQIADILQQISEKMNQASLETRTLNPEAIESAVEAAKNTIMASPDFKNGLQLVKGMQEQIEAGVPPMELVERVMSNQNNILMSNPTNMLTVG